MMQPPFIPIHEEPSAYLYRQPGLFYVYRNSSPVAPAQYYGPQQQYSSHHFSSPIQRHHHTGMESAWTHNAPNQCWQQQQTPTWRYSPKMQARSPPRMQQPMTCLSILNQRTAEEVEADLKNVQLQYSLDKVRNRAMRRISSDSKDVPRLSLV